MSKLNSLFGLALLCTIAAVNCVEQAPIISFGGKTPITDQKQLSDLTKNIAVHFQKLGAQEKKSFELIHLHSATYQSVAGSAYEIFAEIKENDKTSNCTLNLWEKISEDSVKLDVECGPEKRKYQYVSDVAVKGGVGVPGAAIGVPGGFTDLSEIELTELHTKLKPAFVQLGVEHTGFNWMPVRVIDAKKQTVAGTKFLANVEVKNSSNVIKKCAADIWEKTFEHFFQVDLKCENDAKNYKYVKQL